MATSTSFSSQGSTIVVRPHIDSQPTKCCTGCYKDFPETSAYFKAFKKGGLATICVGCTARRSNATRAKEKSEQRIVSRDSRGEKRRVLGDRDPNVKRKAPRLAPKEPVRWAMASQHTREQMRLKAASVTVPVQLTLKLSRALRPQSRLKGIVLLRRIRLSAGGRTDRDWLSEAYVNRAPLSALFFSP
jgi:hypothetical protein